MLRKFSWVAVLFLFAGVSAHAQSIDLFGGYSYMRFRATPASNANGFELAGEYKFRRWLGAVADFTGDYGTHAGVGYGVHTLLFGPQVSFPARISPFGRVFIGGAHFTQGGIGNTSFSDGVGVGVDSKIAPSLAWRMIEIDAIHTHFFGSSQNNLRIATGIVFHF